MLRQNNALSEFDKKMLYTKGRGRNTWSVYFFGETDDGLNINFVYRLNISSLPVGFRYMMIYDTVIAISIPENQPLASPIFDRHKEIIGQYFFERDYSDIRKGMLELDNLSFQGNTSILKGNLDLLELTAYITGASVDVAMDLCPDHWHIGEIGNCKNENQIRAVGEILDDIGACNMDCQGIIRIGTCEYNVKGTAWLEKKYLKFPRGRVKKTSIKSLKVNYIANNSFWEGIKVMDRLCFSTAVDLSELNDNILIDRMDSTFTIMDSGKEGFTSENNAVSFEVLNGGFISPMTGRKYPFPLKVYNEDEKIELIVSPSPLIQEVYSPYERGRVGEYIGMGYIEGIYKDYRISGPCSIEME